MSDSLGMIKQRTSRGETLVVIYGENPRKLFYWLVESIDDYRVACRSILRTALLQDWLTAEVEDMAQEAMKADKHGKTLKVLQYAVKVQHMEMTIRPLQVNPNRKR